MKFLSTILAGGLLMSISCSIQLQAQYSPEEGYGYQGDHNYPLDCEPYICEQNNNHISLYADYLFWRITQEQMQYATVLPGLIEKISSFVSGGNFSGLTTDENVIEPSFDWKSGFRFGAKYGCPCDWGVNLAWTHFNESMGSQVTDPGNNIVPTAFPISSIVGFIGLITGGLSNISIPEVMVAIQDPGFGFANKAKSHWSFKFDTVDLQLGKTCCCSCLTLHPYVGLKAASILQRQRIEYFGFSNLVHSVVKVNKQNHFRAIGPSVGLDAALNLCENLSFSTGVGGAWVYGKFDVKTSPSLHLDIPTGKTESQPIDIAVHAKDKKHNRLRPTANAYFGLDWASCYCGSPIEFGVAYEVQYWWNQWQSPASAEIALLNTSSAAQGDLMMQGVTFSLAIGF